MKCSNCPLYMGYSIESYNGIEDNGVTCGLFGDSWDSKFQYEKDECVVGCYIDRHFIEAQARAEPVRHGRWIETNDATKKRCSECGVIHLIAQYPHGNANYCPNCGEKMDGGAEND